MYMNAKIIMLILSIAALVISIIALSNSYSSYMKSLATTQQIGDQFAEQVCPMMQYSSCSEEKVGTSCMVDKKTGTLFVALCNETNYHACYYNIYNSYYQPTVGTEKSTFEIIDCPHSNCTQTNYTTGRYIDGKIQCLAVDSCCSEWNVCLPCGKENNPNQNFTIDEINRRLGI